MTRVLLTGGNGFIASHILQQLLERGHSVVTTVRSHDKAENIRKSYPQLGRDKLDFTIIRDVTQPDSFAQVLASEPPIEAVIHTASPYVTNATDIQKDLLDPAIKGTTSVLEAVMQHGPRVKQVIVTSSFVSMLDESKGLWPDHVYSEADWCPLTLTEALQNARQGYQASKTFAEKAAWDLVQRQRPNFTLSTILPPLVFGPILPGLGSLSTLSESNQFIRSFMLGSARDNIPPSENPIWADVRDVAQAHVVAMEKPDAGGQRFFVTNGYYSNREIVDVIRKHFPELQGQLPPESVEGGDLPGAIFGLDNRRSRDVLGIEYRSFEDCIVDTVRSIQSLS
ncbi:Glycine-rich RNA-binding protein 2, mitochondrial [Fusarium solani]|nr:Glycine-rich RNA-binding protein 2, mitochondrial [Fusarium solani]